MIDLVTKDNSFYALYNEPFGDVLKAYLIDGANPSMIGMVADAPSPTDKDVTQVAKNVIQFAAQKIEVSGVPDDPRQVVVDALNRIDEQLKKQQLNNGLLCCSVLFIYDHQLYVGGVGDSTITMCNHEGVIRFCHDGPDEPRPEGVENVTIAPADSVGLGPEARLGDLPTAYTEAGVYVLTADPALVIYMFSDGLTKHIPGFYGDIVGQSSDEVFSRVNRVIPKNPEDLLDDICFTAFQIPTALAPISLGSNDLEHSLFTMPTTPVTNPISAQVESQQIMASQSTSSSTKSKKEKKQPQIKLGFGFFVLFMMLLIIIAILLGLGYYAITEWEAYKSQLPKP